MRDLRYRFHGRVKPERRSVLNFAPAPTSEDGVATLRLLDPIDSWGGDWGVSAKEFQAALDALPEGTTEIRLFINSLGGEVFEAVTMVNALRRHEARVVAVVDGIAASCASFLACSADETLMAGNSQLMIHDAWGLCMGNAADMRELAGLLDRQSDNIASIYAMKAGGTSQQWREAMLAETWYFAAEAVDAGLADGLESATATVENTLDLSIFKHAGREKAPAPAALAEPEPESGRRAWQDRRHRMNARRVSAA